MILFVRKWTFTAGKGEIRTLLTGYFPIFNHRNECVAFGGRDN